ncbi:hypothetical protein E4631_07415 [Hymenobacter sp. UV11]|uniref:hypothetical protein n=1 Tax=Hymenobacter sp. UV11 TaxID=1849735 RepID=UPI00107605AC|nr:hypothetical protein [Hymenobacter sp. UV11]TFZ67787.1 hypothetical protein E4631_07415 [Hymenobacter sp. UV11]
MSSPRTAFKLQLFDPARGTSLVIIPLLGLFVLFGIAFGGLATGMLTGPWLAGAYIVAVLGGGGWLGYQAYKKLVIVSAKVLLSDTAIQVVDQDKELLVVPYDTIKAYRYQSFNDAEELRITLKNNERLKIRSNSKLTKVGDFSGMVAAFEAQLTQRQDLGAIEAVTREKSFFEKKISTWLLVAMTVLIGMLTVDLMTGTHSKRPGSLFMVYGNYLIYLGAWIAASARRKEASQTA